MSLDDKIIHRAGARKPGSYTSPIARQGSTDDNWICWYNGEQYSNGAWLCQNGELFQCSYGVWVDQEEKCES